MAKTSRISKKTHGNKLSMETRVSKNGTYLFVKDASGSYHALVEVDTKKALRDCGAEGKGTTRQLAKRFLGF